MKYTVTVLSTEAAAAASGSERCPGGRWAQETRKCLVSGVLEVDSGQGREAASQSVRICARCKCVALQPYPSSLTLATEHIDLPSAFHSDHWPLRVLFLKLSSSRTLVVVILGSHGVLSCYIRYLLILIFLCVNFTMKM